jgi:hypothetical protein
MENFRRHLSAPGLLARVRGCFDKIKDGRDSARLEFSLTDTLMSGLAVFGMKYPSLLRFNNDSGDPVVRENLRNLYGVEKTPSDTRMREILDLLDPNAIRPAFKAVFSQLHNGKELQPFRFIDDAYLVSIDGTGFFSSHEVHCENCCIKQSRDGTITYYHQMLGAVVVHPEQKQLIPLVPEPIIKQDGATKNDCERNAAKRLLTALRNDHPFLKITLLADSLFSNGPTIKLAKRLEMGFIFGVKPGDHKSLFAYLGDASSRGAVEALEIIDNDCVHAFRFINNVPLNDTHPDELVNVLEYSQTSNGRVLTFSWVTDIHLTQDNVYKIMRGGRSRWRIENETFNTLKNQGYQFEHNFGHGLKNLSTVFAYLMMLAFLIDQTQELSCPVFKELLTKMKSRGRLWERLRSFFLTNVAKSWHFLYRCLIHGFQATIIPNSS